MLVEIEKFELPGGIIRVWVNPGAKHGDPYQLTMTVRWIDDETIEFLGLMRRADQPEDELPINFEMWRAIQDEAARLGIKRIKAVRMNTGVERVRWIKTKRQRSSHSANEPLSQSTKP